MENKEILFEKIKKASENVEKKGFDAMEKVWARVEEKLDGKEEKKVLPLWKNAKIEVTKRRKLFGIIEYPKFLSKENPRKQLAIAASIIALFFVGYKYYLSDNVPITSANTIENKLKIEKESNAPNNVMEEEIAKIPNEKLTEKNIPAQNVEDKAFEIAAPVITQEQASAYIQPEKKVEEIARNYPRISNETHISSLPSLPKIVPKTELLSGEKLVAGKVFDQTGAAIPGAGIYLKGTNKGAVTDTNGEFSIKTKIGETLKIASIGFKSTEIAVKEGETVAIKLEEDVQSLSEVVVTGYAVQNKKMMTGAVTVMGNQNSRVMLPKRLQEKAAGVAISNRELKKLEKKIANDPVQTFPKNDKTSTEEYDQFIENQFESPKNAPLSTFSIDVDNASYTNIRRFINSGQKVPKDAVRVEEMVNFFKYNYPQPVDNHPFSINTEYSESPWNTNHKLLRIGLQGKNIATESLPASNLVFLIDVSGSMDETNKLPLLKKSMKILVNELRKEDMVSIVVYAGAAGLVLPPTSGNDKKTIIEALEKLNAGGSTAGGEGIELAYKTAEENFKDGGNNRVIIATDGDFNVGVSAKGDIQDLIEEKRQSGVFLTCLGYGMGNYKDVTLETLADKGNGNYAYIDNMQEANRFLGKEFKGSMFAIAKDVKIQIEFNPKKVAAYRLIGYENRKLKAEDFKNDKIDAGELGSGHTVTALYEIIPVGVESNFIQPDLKYTKTDKNIDNLGNELATVKFRYKKPDGNKSIELMKVIENKPVNLINSSADFKFSTAVAWFGLKLRDSKLIEEKSTDEIMKLAKAGLINDEIGYKTEFVRLVEAVK
jgi:Ca-activated chloride channel family protein